MPFPCSEIRQQEDRDWSITAFGRLVTKLTGAATAGSPGQIETDLLRESVNRRRPYWEISSIPVDDAAYTPKRVTCFASSSLLTQATPCQQAKQQRRSGGNSLFITPTYME